MDETLRQYVLDRDGRRCIRCGESHDQLDVHHITPRSDPENGSDHPENLVSLCPSHHGMMGAASEQLQRKLLWKRSATPSIVERERRLRRQDDFSERFATVHDPLSGWDSYERSVPAEIGLLYNDDRQTLRENGEFGEEMQRRDIRYRVRMAFAQLEHDLNLLRSIGAGGLVQQFYDRFNRVEQAERGVEQLLDESIPRSSQSMPRQQNERVQNRGLLTEDDRAFWSGVKETDDPDKTAREKRHNVRQRIENIVVDLKLLNDAGEDDLVDKFHGETDRNAKIEQELRELREEISEGDDG